MFHTLFELPGPDVHHINFIYIYSIPVDIAINSLYLLLYIYMAVCQNLVPLVNIKIAGKWMFIPLKMVLIGIDP